MARKKSKARKIIIWSSLAVIVIALIVAKKTGLIGAVPPQDVVTEKPTVRDITEIITANGKVQPEIEVKIAPEVSGEIVELAVKEGDYVQKGALLIRIKPDTYVSMKERAEANLASSQAQLSQIAAQLRLAEQTYNRQKLLFSQGAISESEYQTAEGQYKQLQAQQKAAMANVDASKAQLKQSDEDLYKTTIYAPSSGTVSKLSVELGERVVGTATMAGTEMLRLADLSKMEVRAEVNENDIVRVELGDSALIEIDAYMGRKFAGVVTRIANSSIGTGTTISSSSDQVTSYEVRIMITPDSYVDIPLDGAPSPFRPGMSSTVDIMTNSTRALAVPIQAVTTRLSAAGKKEQVVFAFSADSSIVHQKTVKTGLQDKDYIEITEGVDSSMQVVKAPFTAVSKTLVDGAKVQKSADLKPSSVTKPQ